MGSLTYNFKSLLVSAKFGMGFKLPPTLFIAFAKILQLQQHFNYFQILKLFWYFLEPSEPYQKAQNKIMFWNNFFYKNLILIFFQKNLGPPDPPVFYYSQYNILLEIKIYLHSHLRFCRNKKVILCRKNDGETERQIDRKTEKHRDRENERKTEGQKDKKTETKKDRSKEENVCFKELLAIFCWIKKKTKNFY